MVEFQIPIRGGTNDISVSLSSMFGSEWSFQSSINNVLFL